MNPTRNGKIARLPKPVREELNRRLENGEPGRALVEWLNQHPQVRPVLEQQFQGRPINEQNLSEWRQGGFQDWLRHQEARAWVTRLAEEAEELEEDANGEAVSHRLASLLAAELARTAQALLQETPSPRERWHCLRELLPALAALRRADHQAARLRMAEERMNQEQADRDAETERELHEARKSRLLARIWGTVEARLLAPIFGHGEAALNLAAACCEIQNDLELGTLFGSSATARDGHTAPATNPVTVGGPHPTQSNPIKPDQTDPPTVPTAMPTAPTTLGATPGGAGGAEPGG